MQHVDPVKVGMAYGDAAMQHVTWEDGWAAVEGKPCM